MMTQQRTTSINSLWEKKPFYFAHLISSSTFYHHCQVQQRKHILSINYVQEFSFGLWMKKHEYSKGSDSRPFQILKISGSPARLPWKTRVYQLFDNSLQGFNVCLTRFRISCQEFGPESNVNWRRYMCAGLSHLYSPLREGKQGEIERLEVSTSTKERVCLQTPKQLIVFSCSKTKKIREG